LICLDPGSGRKIPAIWHGASANPGVFILEIYPISCHGSLCGALLLHRLVWAAQVYTGVGGGPGIFTRKSSKEAGNTIFGLQVVRFTGVNLHRSSLTFHQLV
jgi:hypothetical protein